MVPTANVIHSTALDVLERARCQHKDWFDVNYADSTSLLAENSGLHRACIGHRTDTNKVAFFRCRRLAQQRLRELQDAWMASKNVEIRSHVAINKDNDLQRSLPETIRVVQQLSNVKAPGSEAIPVEVYKRSGTRMMNKFTTDVCCLSEVRILDSGARDIKIPGVKFHFTLYHGVPRDSSGRHGVAIVLSEQANRARKPVNDRMVNSRLKGHFTNISVVSVYAPTSATEQRDNKTFYLHLQELVERLTWRDLPIVAGDWNVRTGPGDWNGRTSLGSHQKVTLLAGLDLALDATMFHPSPTYAVSCDSFSEGEFADAIQRPTSTLHEVIEQVWRDEVFPNDWGSGILLSVFKKGDKTKCENYHGTSLIDVAAKVFTIVLLRRTKIDEEDVRPISKASQTYGRLRASVWNRCGLYLNTNLKTCKAVLLTMLLCGTET
ncbi:unnamed protein product [Schistocephalus solidus]|uniref:Endo/exonuclease/phosphatase domain-containing protein n=1 Tax=Schistocephalus solidus TaxID=70667 RepID=A0A183S7A4_SCHSO|nr:unnamed protein product [Schistocephalus solidus]